MLLTLTVRRLDVIFYVKAVTEGNSNKMNFVLVFPKLCKYWDTKVSLHTASEMVVISFAKLKKILDMCNTVGLHKNATI